MLCCVLTLLKIPAILFDRANGTFWFTGDTNISAVQYQPVMRPWYEFFGDVFDELQFRSKRGFCICGQANSVGHPEYMCIHRHGRFIKNH